MPRGPIIESLSRHTIQTGWTRSCATCTLVPAVWSDTVGVLQNVAPASISNPVRPDGTRKPSSYSRSVAIFLPPEGKVWNTPSSPSSTRLYAQGPILGRAFVNGYVPDHSEALRLLNDCRMKALSSLTQDTMQFNAAAWELRSTLRGVRDFASKGVNGLRSLGKALAQRTDDKTARSLYRDPPIKWREVPSDYLGWLYGIRPIAGDIENGLLELSGMARKGMAYGFELRRSARLRTPMTTSATTLGLRVDVDLGGYRTSFARLGYRYYFPQWWVENTPPVVTPFSTAWELTRLSFVLDWVLPIGSWIGGLEAAQFDPFFKEGFESYGTDEVCTFVSKVRTADWHVDASPFRCRRYQFNRTALNDTVRPSGLLQFPSFRNFLGVSHAAQGLSLFTQMLKTAPRDW